MPEQTAARTESSFPPSQPSLPTRRSPLTQRSLLSRHSLLVYTMLAFCALLASGLLLGCSANSSHLNKDASLSTAWGTVLEFKVNENWSTSESDTNGNNSAFISYYDKSNPAIEGIIVMAFNPNRSGGGDTYSDWERDIDHVYGSYADYSMTQLDPIESDGRTYRVYRLSYTIAGSGAAAEYYYALLMDGTNEIKIFIIGNERLLRDFVKTMRIS